MADLGHCRVPISKFEQRDLPPSPATGFDHPAKIAVETALQCHVDMVDGLHRTLRAAMAGDARQNPHQRNLPIAPAVSTMRLEKPHSLSYQLTTRTSLPSITAVSRLSTVDEAGV